MHELTFERFEFSRWQSVLAITLIGVLFGVDPSMRVTPPDAPELPVWAAVVLGVLSIWVAFLVILGL